MPPVMRDQPSKAQAEFRVLVARVWSVTRRERDMSIFPRAPLACRVIANDGIGVSKQGGIGINQAQLAQPIWDSVGETVLLLWKDASDILGDPLHLAAGGRGHKRQYERAHPMWVSLGSAPRQTENGPAIHAQSLT